MELHFRVGDVQLGESWIRRVQWGGGGSLPGKPFLIWLHPLRCSSKGPSGEKTEAYPLPQVNSATGPSHFSSPNGSLYKTKGVGRQACFAQGVCLWVTLNFHHNSKNYTYLLPAWLKSWGVVSNFCLPNYLRLRTSGVSTDFRKMKILSKHLLPQGEEFLPRASLIAVKVQCRPDSPLENLSMDVGPARQPRSPLAFPSGGWATFPMRGTVPHN